MSDSHDSDGDFVPGKRSKKKSPMIYSDPEVWESDQENDDTPLKNKSRKSKKSIESESESDSNTESDAMSDDATESDEKLHFGTKKSRKKSSAKPSGSKSKPSGSKSKNPYDESSGSSSSEESEEDLSEGSINFLYRRFSTIELTKETGFWGDVFEENA